MILLTPGPTPVPESIRQAMATETIHHRTPEFEAIFANTRTKLLEIFGMEDVLMLGSTGTGAMEAAVTNLCKKKLLYINAGKFGERFGKIAQAFGLETVELKYDWNTPASIEDVEAALKKEPDIDAIAVQVSESAGGLRHPVEAIAKAAKTINPDIKIIADGITAVGVEKIDTSDIDALIAGSQKAFMLPPGLAMVGLSKAAVASIEASSRGYYFNLASELKKQKANTTAYTAVTTLIIGLGAVLDEVYAMGVDTLYETTQKRHTATLDALKALGMAIYPKNPALSMSTVYTEQSDAIRKILKNKYEINVAGGQDHLKGKIFRINNMGFVKPYETAWALNALELTLDELGIRPFDGTASRVFSQTFYGLGND
jgi:aspartate aminotransferase-like enzyme